MEIGLQCFHLCIEYFGNLRVFKLVIIAKVEHQPLLLGQMTDGFLKPHQLFGRVVITPAVLHLISILSFQVIECNHCLFMFLDETEHFVRRYLVEPCRQFAVTLEGVQMPISPEKSLLQHILGILMTRQHTAYVPIQRLLKPFNQTLETFILIQMNDFQNLFIHVSFDCLSNRPVRPFRSSRKTRSLTFIKSLFEFSHQNRLLSHNKPKKAIHNFRYR